MNITKHIVKTYSKEDLNENLFDSIDNYLDSFDVKDGDDRFYLKSAIMNCIVRIMRMYVDGEKSCNLIEDESQAFGNDSVYWHNEYEKLINAKEFVEHTIRSEIRQLKSQNNSLKESRDSWKAKFKSLEKELFELKRAMPKNYTWPQFADGEHIVPKSRIKVNGEPHYVAEIVYSSNLPNIVVETGECFPEFAIDRPDPDTYLSILQELKPTITEDEISEYMLRLSRIDDNAGTVSID